MSRSSWIWGVLNSVLMEVGNFFHKSKEKGSLRPKINPEQRTDDHKTAVALGNEKRQTIVSSVNGVGLLSPRPVKYHQ